MIDDDDEIESGSLWQMYPDKIEWLRAKDIPSLNTDGEEPQVFTDGIEPGDVFQGTLGDCYFLTVISMAAEFPDRIHHLFDESEE